MIQQEQFQEYLKNPLLFPDAFKDYISDWFALNVPKLHVSQIFGFKILSVKEATEIPNNDTTTSTTYVDLSNVGPTLDNLANGFYVVMFGAHTFSNGLISVSKDGGAASDNDSASGNTAASGNVGRMILVDFSSGDDTHSLQLKYKRVTTSPDQFSDRWLHALRVVVE